MTQPFRDDESQKRRPLSPKQLRFAEEYLVDLCATQAAIRAGYSAKTAGSIANENLTKPEIQRAISEAKAERSKRTKLTADTVLQQLATIAFADIRQVVSWGADGLRLKPSAELTEAAAASVSVSVSVSVSEITQSAGGLRVKLHSKLAALEMLARHLGMYDQTASQPASPQQSEADYKRMAVNDLERLERLFTDALASNDQDHAGR